MIFFVVYVGEYRCLIRYLALKMEKTDIELHAKSDLGFLAQVGEFLRESRLELDFTQNEVARDAGVDRTTLIKAEKGEPVNLLSLIRILRVLNKLDVLESMKFNRQISPIKMAELAEKGKKKAGGVKMRKDRNKSDW